MKRTTDQHKRMKFLFDELGLWNMRADYVIQITGGREWSTRELTFSEADVLIKFLQDKVNERKEASNDEADKHRKRILSCAHQMGWYLRMQVTQDLIMRNGKPVLDMERIDSYCLKHSKAHKKLNDHTLEELSGRGGLVFQFQTMLKNYLKTTTR